MSSAYLSASSSSNGLGKSGVQNRQRSADFCGQVALCGTADGIDKAGDEEE